MVPTGIRTVALNALFLDPGRSGGPETYLRGLVPALVREFPAVHFVVATTQSGASVLCADGWGDFAEIRPLPVDGQRGRLLFAEQVLLPRFAGRRKVDLVHSLASLAPVWTPTPAVITLHDVTFLRVRTFSLATTLAFRAVVTLAAPRADALLTGSVAARDEICSTLGLDPGQFFVVPHGAGRPLGTAIADERVVRHAHQLEATRVALCVGAKRPHKNQELLVRAAPLLPRDVVFVLVGHPENYDTELRSLASQLGVEERVRFVDYLPDDELEAIWRIADCAVFPTLGEGFGLPVLEAMARGLPVACSDIPVLREVGDDVPFYFDPRSERSAATAIAAALDGGGQLEAGRVRAARFTWQRAAHGTFDAYERVVSAARARS